MSASTIRTRVRPGEAVARQLAARRQAMLGERSALAEARIAEHLADYDLEGFAEAGSLAELAARCDAVHAAPGESVAAARGSIAAAAESGNVEEAAARVEELEREDDRRWTSRARRELVLEELVARTGARIEPGSAGFRADGSLAASLRFSGEARIGVTLAGADAADPERERIDWDAAGSSIDGCEEQCAFVERVGEASGLEMAVEEPLEEDEVRHAAGGSL